MAEILKMIEIKSEVIIKMNKLSHANIYNSNEYLLHATARQARPLSLPLIAAIITVLLLSLTGCTGRELDSIAIVTCLEVTADDEAYHVQAEIVRLYDTEREPGQNTEIITASGSDLKQCIDDLNEAEVLHIYLGHLRLIIFDEAFLESASPTDLENITQFVLDSHEIRFNTAIAVSSEDFGSAISGESASTGNRGIDLGDRIHDLHVRSELCDLINHVYGEAAPVSMPVITVSEMNGKSIAVVKADERYVLNAAAAAKA